MSARKIEAFLLRIVIDDESASPEQWRGRIQHVASGAEQKIDQFQDAIAFIAARLTTEEATLLAASSDDAQAPVAKIGVRET
ncbi:MAG: hypothetical protein MUD01_00620 [Chloroflexaceae bacterium]|jgi:hypothetical protein|nr:hypothetical protein [Chloroflexaceae bacterium]